jgi:hypothetical protein
MIYLHEIQNDWLKVLLFSHQGQSWDWQASPRLPAIAQHAHHTAVGRQRVVCRG